MVERFVKSFLIFSADKINEVLINCNQILRCRLSFCKKRRSIYCKKILEELESICYWKFNIDVFQRSFSASDCRFFIKLKKPWKIHAQKRYCDVMEFWWRFNWNYLLIRLRSNVISFIHTIVSKVSVFVPNTIFCNGFCFMLEDRLF